MRTHWILAGSLGLLASLAPQSAGAAMEWVALSVNGCATSIAVGPNNIPWVVGCAPTADVEIFYLKYIRSCNGQLCFSVPSWQDGFHAGARVSVDIDGEPYAVTSSGAVYAVNASHATPSLPTSIWSELSPVPTSAFAEDGFPSPGGCISRLAVTREGPAAPELFVTPPDFVNAQTTEYFGLGCSAAADQPIFAYNPTNDILTWTRLAASQGAAAAQLSLFSELLPTGLVQTLWVMNSVGLLYRYDAASDVFNQVTPSPAGAYSLTDHFVAASFATQFFQDRGVYQWNDATQTFSFYIDTITPNGTSIAQIAYASAFNADTGPVGPSQLWGVDTQGNIFYAIEQPGSPQ